MDSIKELKEKLTQITSYFKEEVSNLRTNRPTTKLVEDIALDYMSSIMPIKQVASISIELPRDIIITPWDKAALPQIEKALREANLGLSVVSQGTLVRAKLPELTEERKREFLKLVKNSAEDARIKIRIARDEANKKTKDLKDEDIRFKTKDDIQKEVNAANRAIEDLLASKIKEMEA